MAGILGLPDHQVLATAAREGRLLVSHERETMPAHFSRFLTDSNSESMAIREAIEEILLV